MSGDTAGEIRCLHPEMMLESNAAITTALFREMVQLAAQREDSVNVDLVVSLLLEREREFPSALGQQVAMPHLHLRGLTSRLLVIARLAQGLDMNAMDDKPVNLVFLLLSPAEDPPGHLATLREIGRLCSNGKVRESLFATPSPVELLRLVEENSNLRRTR